MKYCPIIADHSGQSIGDITWPFEKVQIQTLDQMKSGGRTTVV